MKSLLLLVKKAKNVILLGSERNLPSLLEMSIFDRADPELASQTCKHVYKVLQDEVSTTYLFEILALWKIDPILIKVKRIDI